MQRKSYSATKLLRLRVNNTRNAINANSTNQASDHSAILKPRNRQLTSAQLPSPLNNNSSVFSQGIFSIQKTRPGPQAGTSSAGKCCNHTCLPAVIIPPTVDANASKATIRNPIHERYVKMPINALQTHRKDDGGACQVISLFIAKYQRRFKVNIIVCLYIVCRHKANNHC